MLLDNLMNYIIDNHTVFMYIYQILFKGIIRISLNKPF